MHPTPLPHSFIGFDHLIKLLDRASAETPKTFPPTNIVRDEAGQTTVEMAVAGFREEDLTIEQAGDRLRVAGRPTETARTGQYLHKGIAHRAFERTFALAPHMVVTGATLAHGILAITLEQRVPEALQPRTIPIQAATTPALESETAA